MKKVKRYGPGGTAEEDDLKKQGLEASKNERVGFFERLRMGNIDNPKSEAYQRFGAGRGLAERNKVTAPAPGIRSTDSGMGVQGFGAPMMPKPMPAPAAPEGQVGLRSALTPQGVGEGGTAPEVVERETTTVKTPRKTVTQSKKAVAKPDMAKEKVGKGYEAVTESLRKTPKTSELKSVSDVNDRKRKALLATALGGAGAVLGASALGRKARQGSISTDNRPSSSGTRPRLMGIDPMMEPDLERMAGEGGPNFKKGGKAKSKPVKKYASGGMVGRASKRADGIAKKGKTKGRII